MPSSENEKVFDVEVRVTDSNLSADDIKSAVEDAINNNPDATFKDDSLEVDVKEGGKK